MIYFTESALGHAEITSRSGNPERATDLILFSDESSPFQTDAGRWQWWMAHFDESLFILNILLVNSLNGKYNITTSFLPLESQHCD